jgi:hypothetical protein
MQPAGAAGALRAPRTCAHLSLVARVLRGQRELLLPIISCWSCCWSCGGRHCVRGLDGGDRLSLGLSGLAPSAIWRRDNEAMAVDLLQTASGCCRQRWGAIGASLCLRQAVRVVQGSEVLMKSEGSCLCAQGQWLGVQRLASSPRWQVIDDAAPSPPICYS